MHSLHSCRITDVDLPSTKSLRVNLYVAESWEKDHVPGLFKALAVNERVSYCTMIMYRFIMAYFAIFTSVTSQEFPSKPKLQKSFHRKNCEHALRYMNCLELSDAPQVYHGDW